MSTAAFSFNRFGWFGFVLAALCLLMPSTAAAADASTGADGPTILVADSVLQPDGTLKKDLAVVIQGGKIRRVVPVDDVKGQDVRRLGKGTVLAPGLIDLFSALGLSGLGMSGPAMETARVVDPDANAADAIQPHDEYLAKALRHGITAAMVAPEANNLVSGSCVCFRTLVDGGKIDVLRDDGPLVFALGEGVWQSQRAPTSRAGALLRLRSLLTDAKAGKAHPRINAVVSGRSDALIYCRSGQDVAAARDALGDLARRFVLVHNDDALDLAADAKDLRRPVVVGPYTFATDRRVLLGAAALSDGGAEVAFRGGFPHSAAEGLRITAALAVRHGMEPAAARRAITLAPAKVAGVDGRIGSIAPGKDADLVVFAADPLRLDAAILEVYVQGTRAYNAGGER